MVFSVNVITQTYFWFNIRCCRLGSLTIPFTSVYLNGCKVEGFFKLSTPVLNLAYSAPSTSGSYIWVFATLDPPLIAPPDPHADLAMASIVRDGDSFYDGLCRVCISCIILRVK